MMRTHIQLKLFATLSRLTPPSAGKYPIKKGIDIRQLLKQLRVPAEQVKLVFINNVKADLTATLQGGERVGLFPPIGGG